MAKIYLYPLFVLLIVFGLRLDSHEAWIIPRPSKGSTDVEGWPPAGFKKICFIVAEVEKANGIYRYDPEEVGGNGYPPKMVKLDIIPGTTIDYNVVDEDYYIYSWNLWGVYAIRFSINDLRFEIDAKHPCGDNTGSQIYWKISKAENSAFKGIVQITDVIHDVECVASHGTLTSDIKYEVPVYKLLPTAFACVTWLREVEALSGVKSHATAAEANPSNWTCTLFYEDHSDLTEKTGDNNYCLLKETVSPGEFPGFYTGCKIYVEDPVFAGLWELDFTKSSNHMPYLGLRNSDFSYPSTQIVLRSNFKSDFKARIRDNKLQFFYDGALELEFPMERHFCIGPDTGQIVMTSISEQVSVLYRKDEGMNCVPFFGRTTYNGSSKNGTSKFLEGFLFHTLSRCDDYFKAEYPDKDWKVIVSTVDNGPCVGFGAEVDGTRLELLNSLETYSCYTTKDLTTDE